LGRAEAWDRSRTVSLRLASYRTLHRASGWGLWHVTAALAVLCGVWFLSLTDSGLVGHGDLDLRLRLLQRTPTLLSHFHAGYTTYTGRREIVRRFRDGEKQKSLSCSVPHSEHVHLRIFNPASEQVLVEPPSGTGITNLVTYLLESVSDENIREPRTFMSPGLSMNC
jgi:hypothetical protein